MASPFFFGDAIFLLGRNLSETPRPLVGCKGTAVPCPYNFSSIIRAG
jgi:hypothetical protein